MVAPPFTMMKTYETHKDVQTEPAETKETWLKMGVLSWLTPQWTPSVAASCPSSPR